VVLSDCLQAMSDAVVQATFTLAKPNQAVPPWVYNLPKAEQAAKIAMLKKYGSPNVFTQFQPHLTVAFDTADNLDQIYGALKVTGNFSVSDITVSHVGPHGTVLTNGSLADFPISSTSSTRRFNNKARHSDYCEPSQSYDWDYLFLVREWPGTMTSDSLPSFIDSFTLHGLWPNRNDGSYPQCCNNSYPFSYEEIAPIMSDVERIWYDTVHDVSNGTEFWAHEWSKHGTCAMIGDPSCCSNEYNYFSTCISLHDQMQETKWLANAGIYPADPWDTTYKTTDFVAAIQQGLGQEPLIKCRNSDHQAVIENLAVCLDKNLNLIECPSQVYNQWKQSADCGDEIGIPKINHD